MNGEALGEAIGRVHRTIERKGLTWVLCSGLAHLAGVLVRPSNLAALVVGVIWWGLIGFGVWKMTGGLPDIHWPQWSKAGGVGDTSFVTRGWAQAFLGVLKKNYGGSCNPYPSGSCGVGLGPSQATYAGRAYWYVIEGSADGGSTNAAGGAAQHYCDHLWAVPVDVVKPDPNHFNLPWPFGRDGGWPEVVTLCTVAQGRTAYKFPTLHESGVAN